MKPQAKVPRTDQYSIQGYHDCRPAPLSASEPARHRPKLHRPHRVHQPLDLLRGRFLFDVSDI